MYFIILLYILCIEHSPALIWSTLIMLDIYVYIYTLLIFSVTFVLLFVPNPRSKLLCTLFYLNITEKYRVFLKTSMYSVSFTVFYCFLYTMNHCFNIHFFHVCFLQPPDIAICHSVSNNYFVSDTIRLNQRFQTLNKFSRTGNRTLKLEIQSLMPYSKGFWKERLKKICFKRNVYTIFILNIHIDIK